MTSPVDPRCSDSGADSSKASCSPPYLTVELEDHVESPVILANLTTLINRMRKRATSKDIWRDRSARAITTPSVSFEMKITATVIAFNEEKRIGAALASLDWADEIVVVDSGSADRTVEVASRFTDRVLHNPWPGYAAQKNHAAEAATHNWIFSLDADEVVTGSLAASIRELRKRGPEAAGYRMSRVAWYIDRWVRHGGWYPDWQVRLYDRRQARFEGDHVHESVRLPSRAGTLEGDIAHYTVDSLSDHHRRIDAYTTLAARDRAARGRRFSSLRAVCQPPVTFLQTYLLKQGFRDGAAGLAIAGFAAYYVFLREMKLRLAPRMPESQD